MRRFLCLLTTITAFLEAGLAWASPQDFQLYKLGKPSEQSQENFRFFVNQLGSALTSFSLSAPNTMGHSAFFVGFEYNAIFLDSSSQIWPTEKPSPGHLLLPSFTLRKGLPLSLELGTRISYLQNSRMAAGTLELKWAIHENYGPLPNFAIRGHGTRLIGARDFSLSAVGIDMSIGYQFFLASIFTISPYAGCDLNWIGAKSNIIDFRPDRTFLEAQNDPFADTGKFSAIEMHQNHQYRLHVGFRATSYGLEWGAEVSTLRPYGGKRITSVATQLGTRY